MYSPSNQIQSPDDEEDEEEDQPEDGDNSMSKDSAIKEAALQETFLSYYNHHFVRTQDFTLKPVVAHNQRCPDFVSSVAVSTPLPKMRAKKRKSPVIDVHGGGGCGGGGRCCAVQHSGRKDRHSKVRTATGPRDRRVRLSPTTAIQFYDVQDRLGYDRPSKAIDWLIKEAKAAIDALYEHPNAAENHRLPISKHGGFFISESNDPVSGFGFSVDAAAPSPPPPPEFQAYMDQYFNASRNGSEASEDVIFYPSDQQEFLDLQKMLSWNFGNENSGNPRGGGGGRGVDSPPHLSPAPPISGDRLMFSQREPLQSSFTNYSPINGNFPAFDFDNELSNITASATLKEDETNIEASLEQAIFFRSFSAL